MANDGKIYITISDRRFGTNKAEADEQNQIDKNNNAQSSNSNPLLDYAKHRFFNFIQSEAKQMVNYSINNIGNFTGDYTKQEHVEEAVNILGYMSNIGMAAVAGAQYGGWVGAAIGGGLAILGTEISINQQIYAGRIENTRINRNIAQLRTRAGLNSTNNGSRGTDQ